MRRKFLTPWAVLLLVLVLVLVAAAGCGGDSSSSSDSSTEAATTDTSQSPEQIVKDSETKMAAVKSASFTADVNLEIQGDTSKMSDPTAQALLSDGVSLHVEGKSATQPTTADMSMSVSFAGQSLDFSLMTKGPKSWVEYQGTWYALDAKNAKSLDDQASTGAAPTEQLKSLGLDPNEWGTTYELVGTESVGGVQTNHVKATADPQKLSEAIVKAAQDPELQKKLGSSASDLGASTKELEKQAGELKKMLKDATVDYWIGVDDGLIYKAEVAGSLDTTSQKDMEGVTGMTLKATVTMADFDEPVEVTPPAKSQSIDKLMNEMFGGMMGSGTGT